MREELRGAEINALSAEESKQLLTKIKDKIV